jgi:hypothetical protein
MKHSQVTEPQNEPRCYSVSVVPVVDELNRLIQVYKAYWLYLGGMKRGVL